MFYIVGISMGNNCSPLNTDLLLYCYKSLSLDPSQKLELNCFFNNNFRCLDDILTVNNPHHYP